MSFTQRPGSESPRQYSRREDRHIVRKACVQPTASSGCLPGIVSTFTRVLVSHRNIRRCLAAGHLGSRCPLRVLPLTPTSRRLRFEWCRTRGNWTIAEWNQVIFSDENSDSISAVMTIVFMCGYPMFNASILPLLYNDTPLP
ncbi:HTH_Tnp_Tc3_2 domain-containing protein [Trichonephila clavipes]|nr:HTH_Tnp_Tc3_2 domain-containing protein [Trichonephila clavipes]